MKYQSPTCKQNNAVFFRVASSGMQVVNRPHSEKHRFLYAILKVSKVIWFYYIK